MIISTLSLPSNGNLKPLPYINLKGPLKGPPVPPLWGPQGLANLAQSRATAEAAGEQARLGGLTSLLLMEYGWRFYEFV